MGILQARILERVAISYSSGSYLPKDWTMLSWDGELGIPLQSLQGNQATFWMEAGNPGFFPSWGGKLRVSLELQCGIRGSCGVAICETGLLLGVRISWDSSWLEAGASALISRQGGQHGAHLKLQWETRGSPRVVTGISGNLSLQKGGQASVPVARWNLGLLSSRCRVNGPYLSLRDEFGGFSCIAVKNHGSSWVLTGTSGNLSCILRGVRHPLSCEGKLGIPFKSRQRNPTSLHLELRREIRGSLWVVTGTSGNLLCFLKGVRPPFKMRGGNSGLLLSHYRGIRHHLALKGESCGFSRVAAGSLTFLSSYDRELRECLMFPHRSQASSLVVRGT